MCVHNEKDEHLRMAIDSICHQTYKDIEFIIVDDCSNDSCKQILSRYADQYPSIRIVHNETNLGLTKSLNIGFQQAAGSFIARMDADDFSVPTRIEKQVKFFNVTPDIDICGTGVISFGNSYIYLSPCNGFTNDEAQCSLFFTSTLCHPSVMIRKRFLEKYNLSYDERVTRGQDYDLWERASVFGRMVVLKEVLLYYRLHSGQITSSHKNEQDYFADQTRYRRLSRLNLIPTAKEYACHMLLSGGEDTSISIHDVELWINRIIDANDQTKLVNSAVLKHDLGERFALFKLRNHYYSRLLNLEDLRYLYTIFLSRLQMRQSIRQEINKFSELTFNE